MKIKLTENRKKILVLSCMVVLLVVAGTLSIVLNLNAGKTPDNSLDGTQSTFFSELQSDKELRKNEQIALLDAIINNDNSTKKLLQMQRQRNLQSLQISKLKWL